ncbi:reverse transcriptase domain-containing protein, partial [Tanacetum coccineum]
MAALSIQTAEVEGTRLPPKELWESLERSTKFEDDGSRSAGLLHDIHAEGITLTETFPFAAIIEKLPPSWGKDKDKRKNDNNSKGKAEYLTPKAGIVKQKFQGTCYNCDQPGHRAASCKMPKRATPRVSNMMNDNMDMIVMVSDVIAMISKVNLCMRTRNCNYPNNSTVTIPRRRNRRRAPNIVEPELRTIVEVAPMAERTMEELLRAPTEGYGEAIVIPEINANHFEIMTNFLQLVLASPFHGFERENPHTHINNFKRIASTLK